MSEISKPPPCGVFIAEDHAIAQAGVEFLLRRVQGVEIVGRAQDGEEALQRVAEEEPDILLLDLMLPKKSGLLVLEALGRRQTRPRVLVMSGNASGIDFKRAAELGAEGLISKEDEAEEVIAAIHALRDGGTYRSPVVRALLEPLGETGSGLGEGESLTAREREILALVAEGYSNAKIGSTLGISVKTAKKQRWQCQARAVDDQKVAGPWGKAEGTVYNAKPGPAKLSIAPAQPKAGDEMKCEIATASADPDGDNIRYDFYWYKDGMKQKLNTSTSAVAGSKVKRRDIWRCEAVPRDGVAEGPRARSADVVVR